jgi:hypothetical protein
VVVGAFAGLVVLVVGLAALVYFVTH